MKRLAPLVPLLLLAGCGGGSSSSSTSSSSSDPVAVAQHPVASDFPPAHGKTLRQLTQGLKPAQAGLAVSDLVPGRNRVAFGVISSKGSFAYGPTAIYLARSENGPVQGPFLAPADAMTVSSAFRSKTAAQDPDSVKAIYRADLSLARPGRYLALTVTRQGKASLGAPTEFTVKTHDSIPSVGQRPPAVATEVRGQVPRALLTTRVPPEDMANVSFRDVVGKKPVALLFATPALCQSRVCGPVTDLLLAAKARYGDTYAFIHQEVYKNNQIKDGLREPLRAFHLQSEPWLFVVNRQGRIAARLEGAFGAADLERALQAGLK